MSFHTISNDIKARVPPMFHEHGLKVKQICALLDVKKSLVYNILKTHRVHGTTHNPDARRRGRHRQLSQVDISFIRSYLSQKTTAYIDEIQNELLERRGVTISLPTLTRTLQRLNITLKGTSVKALERDEMKRALYMNKIGDLITDPNQLMFGDEAAKDERTSGRRKGWSLRGTRCPLRKPFVRGRRYSILPILTLDGIITYDIFEGSVTSKKFIKFLKELVLPLTDPYPGPRSVLVLDNCSIHHAEEIRALVEDEALCKLVFLPPYSPDYNPIEQAFSSIKAYLRRHHEDKSLGVMDRACQQITYIKAAGYFKASGYIV